MQVSNQKLERGEHIVTVWPDQDTMLNGMVLRLEYAEEVGAQESDLGFTQCPDLLLGDFPLLKTVKNYLTVKIVNICEKFHFFSSYFKKWLVNFPKMGGLSRKGKNCTHTVSNSWFGEVLTP